ncbi:MAG TPA: FAD binding domain-containing protein [Stellaceae bacterium]|nr:FAD binding domain-containing protein [Stellaceae bacterium]
MKPAPFTYHAPHDLTEAVGLLASLGDDGRILAGGQSLVPTMAFRLALPEHLIDINGIAGLDYLDVSDGVLRIGPLVRHAAFHRPVLAGPLGGLLSFVVRHIAHYPIRTRGTFCGSLAHADPAAEWGLVAATLDASVTARSERGERVVPVAQLFEWIMTTTLADDEMLVEARLPVLAPATRWGFYEFNRRAGDYAMAMALVAFEVTENRIVAPRLGMGGVEGFPRRLAEVEAVLSGRAPNPVLFREAAEAAAAAVDPLEDAQIDLTYRRDLVRAVTERALQRAMTMDRSAGHE